MAELIDQQNGAAQSAVVNGASAKAPPPPLSYGLVVPRLIIQAPRASEAIHFYKRAFGAEEVRKPLLAKRRADQEQPLILHAHLKFGDAEIMLCDEAECMGPNLKSPLHLKGTTATLHIETNDVDAAFARALEAGATTVEEVSDRFWGHRYGRLADPFGFDWSLATPIKDFTEAAAVATEEAVVQDGTVDQ